MQYAINPRKQKTTAHYWLGEDTACKMYSTGGMRKTRYKLFDSTMGKPICTMCENNKKKIDEPKSLIEYLSQFT